jgi:hypothetical protein
MNELLNQEIVTQQNRHKAQGLSYSVFKSVSL